MFCFDWLRTARSAADTFQLSKQAKLKLLLSLFFFMSRKTELTRFKSFSLSKSMFSPPHKRERKPTRVSCSRGGGGGTQKSFIRGGSAPRTKPLTLLYTIFSDKAPLSYTFYCHFLVIFFHVARNKLKWNSHKLRLVGYQLEVDKGKLTAVANLKLFKFATAVNLPLSTSSW